MLHSLCFFQVSISPIVCMCIRALICSHYRFWRAVVVASVAQILSFSSFLYHQWQRSAPKAVTSLRFTRNFARMQLPGLCNSPHLKWKFWTTDSIPIPESIVTLPHILYLYTSGANSTSTIPPPIFPSFWGTKKKLKPSMFTINSSTESNYIDCPFFLGSGVSWSLE